ncbi:hypothetical protein [Pseudogulbenkiania subflava]|nr:hypothetical protein [Pseudogulbenkiania subflava]
MKGIITANTTAVTIVETTVMAHHRGLAMATVCSQMEVELAAQVAAS